MMVLFYDNNRESQAGQLTDALGERWLSVSPEGSRYWSPLSNTPGPLSDHHHYGFLPTHEPDVRDFLGSLARLMGLYDAYIKPSAPKGLHVYDSSKPPSPKNKAKKKRRTVEKKKMSKIRPAPIVDASKRRKDMDR